MSLEDWAHRFATTPPAERISVWRAHRIDEILGGHTPKRLTDDPTVVYHLFPPTAFSGVTDLPLVVEPQLNILGGFSAPRWRVNIDGILVMDRDHHGYVQLYRDGIVEYASSDIISIPDSNDVLRQPLLDFIRNFPYALREQVLRQPPTDDWTYAVTLLHMGGKAFENTGANAGFDRDTIILPPITGTLNNVVTTLRQLVQEANGNQ